MRGRRREVDDHRQEPALRRACTGVQRLAQVGRDPLAAAWLARLLGGGVQPKREDEGDRGENSRCGNQQPRVRMLDKPNRQHQPPDGEASIQRSHPHQPVARHAGATGGSEVGDTAVDRGAQHPADGERREQAQPDIVRHRRGKHRRGAHYGQQRHDRRSDAGDDLAAAPRGFQLEIEVRSGGPCFHRCLLPGVRNAASDYGQQRSDRPEKFRGCAGYGSPVATGPGKTGVPKHRFDSL